jgi:glycosyltransferase involved in cell wall biosynthesis
MINPSRFEGWSSTVEEAKGMGKRVILSNIPVHREQNPPGAVFFEPDDSSALAAAMANYWRDSSDFISPEDARKAKEDLRQRTLAYAARYTDVVLSVENKGVVLTPKAELNEQ